MASRWNEGHSARRTVLVADPNCTRRQRLAQPSGRPIAMEAASLCEAFPLAEQAVPDVLALSADFLVEPDFEGLLKLGDMLGSQMFLYTSDGHLPARGQRYAQLPCVTMEPGDDITHLLARLTDHAPRSIRDSKPLRAPDMILLGASTGGIAAIEAVLVTFPVDCPPTLVVQHMRDGFVPGLAKRLNEVCRPMVVLAAEGDALKRGTVYFASDSNRHLMIKGMSGPRIALVDGPPRNGHRPAVDSLFDSALPWASGVTAALLTGMGQDGAAGLGALRRAGAHTIAQDQATSIVWGMPRAAVEAGAASEVLPIDRIGHALLARREQDHRPLARGMFR
ncbi:MAG: hypothetical protein RIQ75_707 [Pseudomonadota bacterium]